MKDALVVSAQGRSAGGRSSLGVMEYGFMGGSMGSVVGEKVTRCAERALADRAPLIVVSCSGGARMQEGALSLMQMAKISTRPGAAGRRRVALYFDPDGSDDRRRNGFVRDAR